MLDWQWPRAARTLQWPTLHILLSIDEAWCHPRFPIANAGLALDLDATPGPCKRLPGSAQGTRMVQFPQLVLYPVWRKAGGL